MHNIMLLMCYRLANASLYTSHPPGWLFIFFFIPFTVVYLRAKINIMPAHVGE